MIQLLSLVGLYFSLAVCDVFPTCGDCWCVPDNGGLDKCPTDWTPQTSFSKSVIDSYNAQIPNNIYTLSCNPYKDASCVTNPVQSSSKSTELVCGFVYPKYTNGSESCENYSMQTFENTQIALDYGAVLTHAGACGLCSTAQDLAIYLSELYFLKFNFTIIMWSKYICS